MSREEADVTQHHNSSQAAASEPNGMGRRTFMAKAAGVAGATVAGAILAGSALGQTPQDGGGRRNYDPAAGPGRYPDPDIITLDPRFKKYAIGNTPIRRLQTGSLWSEGPAWNGVGQYLIWSDIPNNLQRRWLMADGYVGVHRNPSNYSNGNTFDWEGRQISCEHGNRRVVRYEHNGEVTVLADKWQGKPFNAPNDVAVHPDGGIWFTDPGYGSLGHYEGNKGKLELKEAVYRIDGKSLKLEMATDAPFKANGLCFSPDFKKLYIADTGASHYPQAVKNIQVFDVMGNKLRNGREFASMKMTLKGQEVAGMADGIRADTDGNIWAAGGWVGDGYDGVHIFAPDGVRIGQILLPEICSNLCFGGPKRNRLFMTAGQSLYSVYTEAQGAGSA